MPGPRNRRWCLDPPVGTLVRMSPRQIGLLAALSAIWGGSYLLIKYALEDLSAPMIVWSRVAVAAVVLLGLIRMTMGPGAVRGVGHELSNRPRSALLLGTVAVALPFTLITLGELEVPSGLTAVLISPASLFVALFAPWIDPSERIDRRQAVGMLVGLGGVALVVGVESVQSLGELLGALAMLGAAACYALSSFVVKRRYGHMAAMQTSLVSIAVTAVLTLPLAVATLPSAVPGAGAAGDAAPRRGRDGAGVRDLLQADQRGRRGPRLAGLLPRAGRGALLRRAAARRGGHRRGDRRPGADPRRGRDRLASAGQPFTNCSTALRFSDSSTTRPAPPSGSVTPPDGLSTRAF